MMITIFNRKNIYIGYDLKGYSDIRTLLADNHIPYKAGVKNRMGQWTGHGTLRGRTGSFGQSPETACEYEVFVHRKDYDRAMHLIQNQK